MKERDGLVGKRSVASWQEEEEERGGWRVDDGEGWGEEEGFVGVFF